MYLLKESLQRTLSDSDHECCRMAQAQNLSQPIEILQMHWRHQWLRSGDHGQQQLLRQAQDV